MNRSINAFYSILICSNYFYVGAVGLEKNPCIFRSVLKNRTEERKKAIILFFSALNYYSFLQKKKKVLHLCTRERKNYCQVFGLNYDMDCGGPVTFLPFPSENDHWKKKEGEMSSSKRRKKSQPPINGVKSKIQATFFLTITFLEKKVLL